MSGVHDIICLCINPYQSSLIWSNIAVFFNQFYVACTRLSNPLLVSPSVCWSVTLCFLGSGPEGADDLCFHTGEIFPSSPSSSPSTPSNLKSSLEAQNLASRLNYQPWSSNSSLEAQIPASNLKFQLQTSNSSFIPQIPAWKPRIQPQGSKLSLKAQNPASRLKIRPCGPNSSLKIKF